MLRTLALSLFLVSAPAAAEAPANTTWVSYGQPMTVETTPIPAKDFLADPSAHVGKTVLIEGRIADVCQKAGCWMVLAEGDKSIRVLTKAHKFSVAKDSTGQECRIEGEVRAKEIKAEEVAHFESESAKKDLIPEKSVQGTMTYELVASGVQLLRPTE
jgi:hypothetical protein